MAKRSRRPTAQKPQTSTTTSEDAFTASVLELVAWARDRTQSLIVGGIILVILVTGTLYWFDQRATQLDAAAGELEQLQQNVGFEDPATAVASIQGYLDRYGGTVYEIEARLLLARVHLIGNEDANAAIAVLQEVAPDYGSPLGVDATFMLAAAYEQAERWVEAIQIYEELVARVDFAFQQKEATEGLARSRLAQGDIPAAIQAYESVLDQLEPDDPERALYEMRLAELRARTG